MKKITSFFLAAVFLVATSVAALADTSAVAVGQTKSGATAQIINNGGPPSVIPQDSLLAPPVLPQALPLLNGSIGDATSSMPIIYGIQKLGPNDEVVNILEVQNGGFFTSVRYEDVESVVVELSKKYRSEKKYNMKYIRYSVKFKSSSSAIGIGGGAAGALANPFAALSGAIIPSANASTVNPKFFVTIYEVIPGREVVKAPVPECKPSAPVKSML